MVAALPLTLAGVTVHKRGARLLGPVDLGIHAGGATIVLGPNGAGKTTLLKAAHGIERTSGGTVTWAAPRAEADLAQAYVFQTPILLRRTVRDNVAYPLTLRGQGRRAARDGADRALASVGLAEIAHLRAHDISGGEKQKLALARAIVTQPQILFLDEPTASLDGRATREIETILTGLAQAGTKLVMATHDLGQARRLAAEVVFLLNGTVHEAAPADAFFAGPETPEAAGFLRGDIIE